MNKYISILLLSLSLLLVGCSDENETLQMKSSDATASFSVAEFKTMENITPIRIPVVLSNPVGHDVKVTAFIKSESGMKEGEDYVVKNKVLEIKAGKSSEVIEVLVEDDLIENPDRSFTLEIVESVGAKINEKLDECVVIVQSDEGKPILSLEETIYNFAEESREDSIHLVLNKPTDKEVICLLKVNNGTALENDHFTMETKRVTFAAGETRKKVAIHIIDDFDINENRWFEIMVEEAENAMIEEVAASSKITLINDERESFISFTKTKQQVLEEHGSVWLPFLVQGNPRKPISVVIEARSGRAVEGKDYVVDSWKIDLPVGVLADSIRVDILDNDEIDLNRDVVFGFGELENVSKFKKDTLSTVIIENDDVDMNLLYENMMGSWIMTQTSTEKSPLSCVIEIYGGDTPEEEDQNYNKKFKCRATSFVWGKDFVFTMTFDAKTGAMEVVCGETVMTETFAEPWGKCNMKLEHGEELITPISTIHNKNFTHIKWENVDKLRANCYDFETDERLLLYHFGLANVELRKVE